MPMSDAARIVAYSFGPADEGLVEGQDWRLRSRCTPPGPSP